MLNTLYIYSERYSNRLEYACFILFKTVLKVNYKIVNSIAEIEGLMPVLYYSDNESLNGIVIKPHALLFESQIIPQDITVEFVDHKPYFFKTSSEGGIKYDILASTFYMASRYEEYLPTILDVHGRFKAESSLAYQNSFLHLPVVHLWADTLKNELLKRYSSLDFPNLQFKQISTIDVDVAYAFKGKPLFRQLGNIAKSVLTLDVLELKNRLIYWSTGKDYLDTYDYLDSIISQKNIPLVTFVEVGKYAKYDRNIPLNNIYKTLIKYLMRIGEVGIHPSYQSNFDDTVLPQLIQSLEKIVGFSIAKSRQHFLMLRFPDTYEGLINNGLTEDYTMGFADHIGFRAGLCVPYPFFNLVTNTQRPLTIVPFQVMDGTLKDYMKLDVKMAKSKIQQLKQQVRLVGGVFVSLFHNSSLTNQDQWSGWREVFESQF